MKTIRVASVAALALGLYGACSQGADSDTFGGFPPGPTPSSAGDSGPATFGVDSEGTVPEGGCCLPQSEPGIRQLRAGLLDFGYVEGKNYVLMIRLADDNAGFV